MEKGERKEGRKSEREKKPALLSKYPSLYINKWKG